MAQRPGWRRLHFFRAIVFGVVLFATALQPVVALILATDIDTSQQVAAVHTVFNLAAGLVALLLQPLIWPRLEAWLHKDA